MHGSQTGAKKVPTLARKRVSARELPAEVAQRRVHPRVGLHGLPDPPKQQDLRFVLPNYKNLLVDLLFGSSKGSGFRETQRSKHPSVCATDMQLGGHQFGGRVSRFCLSSCQVGRRHVSHGVCYLQAPYIHSYHCLKRSPDHSKYPTARQSQQVSTWTPRNGISTMSRNVSARNYICWESTPQHQNATSQPHKANKKKILLSCSPDCTTVLSASARDMSSGVWMQEIPHSAPRSGLLRTTRESAALMLGEMAAGRHVSHWHGMAK